MMLKTLASFASAPAFAFAATAAASPYSDAVLLDNPVSYFQFEGNANDSGSGANDGTLIGPTSTYATGSFGIGQFFQDATGGTTNATVTNAISLPTTATAGSLLTDLQGASGITIEFLVDIASVTSAGNNFFLPTPGNSAGAAARLTSSGVNIGGRSQNGDAFQSLSLFDGTVFTGVHHVAGVLDFANDRIDIYVDGVLEATSTASFGSDTFVVSNGTDRPISIGASPGNNLAANYDELAIYGSALTRAQIQAHVAAIPEPASLALLGAGATLILGRRRK